MAEPQPVTFNGISADMYPVVVLQPSWAPIVSDVKVRLVVFSRGLLAMMALFAQCIGADMHPVVVVLPPSWAPIVSDVKVRLVVFSRGLQAMMALCAHNELVQTCTHGVVAAAVLGAHRE